MSPTPAYTPYPEINPLIHELLTGAQRVLGPGFTGLYLEGSLASGDFDADSDIDFVVVYDGTVDADQFAALQALHERLARFDPRWGSKLEGSYVSRAALRRVEPADLLHPNIEWGEGERLKWMAHDETWNVHRWVLREWGLCLAGPELKTLIDPVTAEDLRQGMRKVSATWLAGLLADPGGLRGSEYQSYTVLSLCRIGYTLQTGRVASKPAALRWALTNLDPKWRALIEDAWVGRHAGGRAEEEKIRQTLDMIRAVQAGLG